MMLQANGLGPHFGYKTWHHHFLGGSHFIHKIFITIMTGTWAASCLKCLRSWVSNLSSQLLAFLHCQLAVDRESGDPPNIHVCVFSILLLFFFNEVELSRTGNRNVELCLHVYFYFLENNFEFCVQMQCLKERKRNFRLTFLLTRGDVL